MKESEKRSVQKLSEALDKILSGESTLIDDDIFSKPEILGENIIDHGSIINDLGADMPKYQKETLEDIKRLFNISLTKKLLNKNIILNDSIKIICGIFNDKVGMFLSLHNDRDHNTHAFTKDPLMDVFESQLPIKIGSYNRKVLDIIREIIEEIREKYDSLETYNQPPLDTKATGNEKIVPDRTSPMER